jgi:hypothetical protein
MTKFLDNHIYGKPESLLHYSICDSTDMGNDQRNTVAYIRHAVPDIEIRQLYERIGCDPVYQKRILFSP